MKLSFSVFLLFFVAATVAAQELANESQNSEGLPFAIIDSNTINILPALIQILLICGIFGALGGLTAHYLNNERKPPASNKDESKLSASSMSIDWYVFPSRLESIVIGITGALGFLFFIIAVGGITTNFSSLQEYIRTISSSVIAGFGARSLLPKMAGQLERQVAEASSKADEAVDEAKLSVKKVKEMEESIELLKTNIKLVDACNPATSAEERQEAIRLGEKQIQGTNANSATWVNLARAYRWDGNIEKAIETLDQCIKNMETERVDRLHIEVAYYNRGCYKSLRYRDNRDQILRDSCISDLKKALSLAADRAEAIKYVIGDDDWKYVADDEAFKTLIGSN